MASSGSNKAGPSKRIFEQLEKGVAAEHAPSVSSKSDGSATSIPDAGQMSSGSNMGSTEGTRFLHKQHRRHSPKAMREQAAPKAFGCSIEPAPPCWLNWTAGASQADMESRSIPPVNLEHRGVTEHVSPGCSATCPQQSDQIHRRVSPVSNDDDDSDGYSDRKNPSSDSEGEIAYKLDAITIEYRFPSGESACRSLSISYWGLSCGVLWFHLRCCRVDMDNVKLLVGTQVINEVGEIELLTSVREQLQATPGVLRITVVRSL